jgi:hypothetical protein
VLGEIDGTQCDVPRSFATFIWMCAAMARGGGKLHAGYVGCTSLAGRSSIPACRGSADPIAGPMKLVRRNFPFGMADALRDRLHGRPLVDRATTNNGLRRSFTR